MPHYVVICADCELELGPRVEAIEQPIRACIDATTSSAHERTTGHRMGRIRQVDTEAPLPFSGTITVTIVGEK